MTSSSPSTRSSTNTRTPLSKEAMKDILDKEKSKDLNLPVSRIRSIMKHAEDTQNISQDSIHVMTKVAELFIQHLAQGAYKTAGETKRLDYKDIAEYVQTSTPLTFMREILPRKITFREYKQIIKKKGVVISSLGTDSSDESSDEGSSSSDNSGSSSGESDSPAPKAE